MTPNALEAVRCALQSVCETGGTMDEIALIEQHDHIANLEAELRTWRSLGQGHGIEHIVAENEDIKAKAGRLEKVEAAGKLLAGAVREVNDGSIAVVGGAELRGFLATLEGIDNGD